MAFLRTGKASAMELYAGSYADPARWASKFSARTLGPSMPLEIIVPGLMGCALLWWVGRGMSWTMRLTVAAGTVVLIAGIVLFERGVR